MPFFNDTVASKYIPSSQIKDVRSKVPETLDALYTDLDRIITEKAGVQPPNTPGGVTNTQILLYGSHVLRWMLLPWITASEKELTLITDNRELAFRELANLRDVTLDANYTPPTTTYQTTSRLGSML